MAGTNWYYVKVRLYPSLVSADTSLSQHTAVFDMKSCWWFLDDLLIALFTFVGVFLAPFKYILLHYVSLKININPWKAYWTDVKLHSIYAVKQNACWIQLGCKWNHSFIIDQHIYIKIRFWLYHKYLFGNQLKIATERPINRLYSLLSLHFFHN